MAKMIGRVWIVVALLYLSAAQWHPEEGSLDRFMHDRNQDESISDMVGQTAGRVFSWVSEKLAGQMEDALDFFDWKGVVVDFAQVDMKRTIETHEKYKQDVVQDMQESLYAPPAKPLKGFSPPGKERFPYFNVFPQYVDSIIPDGPKIAWSAPCFGHMTAQAISHKDEHGELTVKVILRAHDPQSTLCKDHYLFATVEGAKLKGVFFHGTHTMTWTVPSSFKESEQWDVVTKGIRVFRFVDNPLQTLANLKETALLFLQPLTHAHVSKESADRNLYFLEHYAQIKPSMRPRSTHAVPINESLIQSGDFFGVVRLDGLDPMLAWAMGSTTGHTTVALRDPGDGSLWIAESTAKSSYWPVNGVQKTPFKEWMERATKADFNVVWAPLSQEKRDAFDAEAAFEFLETVEGIDYGYQNILWGWIDTMKGNYPCLPPDYDVCLQWELIEVVFAWIDRMLPSLGDLFFNEAWNLRLGTSGLKAADLYKRAYDMGIKSQEIPTIVEQDSWEYNMKRFGKEVSAKSQVCCVLVCNVWKHGGLFNDIDGDLNCAELTNWDDQSLRIFSKTMTGTNRPQQCKEADPENPLCQLTGKYSLQLNNFNTVPMHHHMAETCPSLAPGYVRSPTC